jgi:hypothetical protein
MRRTIELFNSHHQIEGQDPATIHLDGLEADLESIWSMAASQATPNERGSNTSMIHRFPAK